MVNISVLLLWLNLRWLHCLWEEGKLSSGGLWTHFCTVIVYTLIWGKLQVHLNESCKQLFTCEHFQLTIGLLWVFCPRLGSYSLQNKCALILLLNSFTENRNTVLRKIWKFFTLKKLLQSLRWQQTLGCDVLDTASSQYRRPANKLWIRTKILMVLALGIH